MRTSLPAARTRTSTRPVSTPLNLAHRGASGRAPENTLAAVAAAVETGADLVEVDVHRTRDGALVLMHDTTLVRTTNAREVFPRRAPWRIADFTLEELSRLDAGVLRPDQGIERVPTLEEVFALLAGTRTGLLVELKAPERYPGIVVDLAATLGRLRGPVSPETTPVAVQSFSYVSMKELKTQLPDVSVGVLGAPPKANLRALGTWVQQVNPHHLSVDRSYVEAVHQAGMTCHVWTVNRTATMKRALRLGVDGVITDRPELLGRLLRARWADVTKSG